MAFSANQQQVINLFIAAYGRAPAQAGLDWFTEQLDNGDMTVSQIRDFMMDTTNNPEAAARFPDDVSTQEKVESVFMNVLGRGTATQEGLEYWSNRVDNEDGYTMADLMEDVLNAAQNAEVDAATLANKSAAAEYFLNTTPVSEQPGSQISLDTVTDDESLNTVIETITSGNTSELTNGIDKIEAYIFNSSPAYTPAGNDFINTLQSEDELTGTGTGSTLNVTLGSVNDGAETLIAPKLTNIDTINLEVAGNIDGLNFQDIHGTEHLNIQRIVADNSTLTFSDIQDDLETITVNNSTRSGDLTFQYAEVALRGDADAVTLNLNNVTMNNISMTQGDSVAGDSVEDEGYGIETFTVNVTEVTNLDKLSLNANTREEIDNATTQLATINVNADLELNELVLNGAETININTTNSADMIVTLNEHNNAESNNNYGLDTADASNNDQDAFVSSQMNSMTITGDGKVTLNGVNATATATDVTIDASAMTDTLAIRLDDAAVTNIANEERSLASGAGDDEIITTTNTDMSITSNAGADLLNIGGNMNATVSTGAGADDINVAGNINDDMNTGSEADTVDAVSLNDANLTTESGADVITLTGAVTNTTGTTKTINTGSENDTLTIAGDVAANVAIETETGDDSIVIGGNSSFTSTTSFFTVTMPAATTQNYSTYNSDEILDATDTTTITLTGVDNGAGTDLTISFTGMTAEALEDAIVAALNGDTLLSSLTSNVDTNAANSTTVQTLLNNNQHITADVVQATTGYFELATDNVTFSITHTDADGTNPTPSTNVTQNDTWQGTLAADTLSNVAATIDTAEGDDSVSLHANTSATIDLGTGSDTLTIDGNVTAAITAGSDAETDNTNGQDTITIAGTTSTAATITTAAGDDSVSIKGDTSGNITTDSGNDTVAIGNVSNVSDLTAAAVISTGTGDDTVSITGNVDVTEVTRSADNADGMVISATPVTAIDLGTGSDTLNIDGDLNRAVMADEADSADNGADTITVDGDLGGYADITTLDGDDVVTVGNLGVADADAMVSDATTETDVNGALDQKGAGKTVSNSNIDVTNASDIITGAGNDTVIAGSLNSAGQYNDNVISDGGNTDDTITIVGASIVTGEGSDTVRLTKLTDDALMAEQTLVSTGADADTVTMNINAGTLLEADNAKTGGLTSIEADTANLGAKVDLGAGSDTLTINDIDDLGTLASSESTLVVDRGAVIDGGSDADTLTINTIDDMTVVASKTYHNDTNSLATLNANNDNTVIAGQGGHIVGIETITLNNVDSITQAQANAENVDEDNSDAVSGDEIKYIGNDDNANKTKSSIDIEQIDSALTTLNLNSQEARHKIANIGQIDAVDGTAGDAPEADDETEGSANNGTAQVDAITNGYTQGEVTTFEVENFRDDANISLNLTANETNVDSVLVGEAGYSIEDDCAADVNVSVNMDAISTIAVEANSSNINENRTFTLDLNQSTVEVNADANYDVALSSENANVTMDTANNTSDEIDARYARDIILNVNTQASNVIDLDDTFGNVADSVYKVYSATTIDTVTTYAYLDTVEAISVAAALSAVVNSAVVKFNVYNGTTLLGAAYGIDNDSAVAQYNATHDVNAAAAGNGSVSTTAIATEVETSLTINNSTAGEELTVTNVSADAITSNGAADTFINVAISNDYAISTTTGDDVINMSNDTVDASDTIDAGEGYNTLVIGDQDLDLNNAANNIQNIDRVVVQLTEGTDTANTGPVIAVNSSLTDKIEIVNVPETDKGLGINDTDDDDLDAVHNVTINDAGTGSLTIDANTDNSADLQAEACPATDDNTHSDALALDITSNASELTVNTNVSEGTRITLTNAAEANTVSIVSEMSSITDNTISSDNDGDVDGLLDINTVGTSAIDTITLTGNLGFDANIDGDENTTTNDSSRNISLTVDNTWANTTALVIDAADATATTGGLTIDATALTGDILVQATNNVFDASAETTVGVHIKATDGKDTITGGEKADVLEGNAGNDIISGNFGNDYIFGGAGDDIIAGDKGADILTGGAGADTFVINHVDESNGQVTDTITDFATSSDVLDIHLETLTAAAVLDFSNFTTVANTGDGDDSLSGTVADKVIGDTYYSTQSGVAKFVMDVNGDGDITEIDDITIMSPNAINAGDINVTVNTGEGSDLIRLGQGIEVVDAAAGDDTFVVVGSIDSSQTEAYIASGEDTEITDYNLSAVVEYNTLTQERTESEVQAGDSITGGNNTDTLHVFGETNFTGVTIAGIEELVTHSDLTLSKSQVSTAVSGNTYTLMSIEDSTDNNMLTISGLANNDILDFDNESSTDFSLVNSLADVDAAGDYYYADNVLSYFTTEVENITLTGITSVSVSNNDMTMIIS